jgi:ligand-binding SRPBCC domain-containing protein
LRALLCKYLSKQLKISQPRRDTLMVDHIIEQRAVIGRSRPEVFAFFADPRNVGRLVPPWLRVTLVSGESAVQAGTVLDYDVTCLGVRVRWRTFVREFDPPFRFLDVQLDGPFARWEHRHRFLATAQGTLMEDRLVYRLPLGLVGRAGHAVALGPLLAAAWRHRARRIGDLIGPVSSPAG